MKNLIKREWHNANNQRHQVRHQMENLTYHNQLLVKKTIDKGNQLEVLESLLKMGLTTAESENLFQSLLSSMKMTVNQRLNLLVLTHEWILNETIKVKVVNLLNQWGPFEPLETRETRF